MCSKMTHRGPRDEEEERGVEPKLVGLSHGRERYRKIMGDW